MKIKFDLSGAVEKMTCFDKLEGKANIDAHFEIEFGADELGMIYEAQRALVPEVLSFVKEMQQLSKEENNMSDLEKSRLESKIEGLEIQLNGERKRHSKTQKERDEYFEKYIKSLDKITKIHEEEVEKLKKENKEIEKSLGIKEEEDDDKLY